MASAAMNVAAHSIPPPYAIPVGPRVRPPRLLPGTKADNINPQPPGPVPENAVWVQGRWRNPSSNAARDRQLLKSKQVEKALRDHTHGMNIYAYRQMLTNQVVYSLTRSMQNNKILPQLVYHKKKSVPAALRRDVWRPYFSIHFPRTPAGAQAGLKAYQQLRELALKRQLSPPREMLIATREDVEKERKRINPADLRDMLTTHHIKNWPRLNQLLPARYRAQKLMDQKATSVADAAYVLQLLNEGDSPAERLARIEEQRVRRHKARTPGDRRRVNRIAEMEQYKAEEIKSRQQSLEPQGGQMGLDRHVAERLAIEYGGALSDNNVLTQLQDIEFAKEQTAKSQIPSIRTAIREAAPAPFDAAKLRQLFTEEWNQQYQGVIEKPEFPTEEMEADIRSKRDAHVQLMKEHELRRDDIAELVRKDKETQELTSRVVQILWADKRDGTYAEAWPENVYHGWLEPKAVLKKEMTVVRQQAHTDAFGSEISEQKQTILVQASSSPHIFGRDTDEGWFKLPEQQQEDVKQQTALRVGSVKGREMVVGDIIEHRSRSSFRNRKSGLRALSNRYPVYMETLDGIDEWTETIEKAEKLRRFLQLRDAKAEDLRQQIKDLDSEAQSSGETAREQMDAITSLEALEAKIRADKAAQQARLDKLDATVEELSHSYPGLQTFARDWWLAKNALEQAHESGDDEGQIAGLETELAAASKEFKARKIEYVLDNHRQILEERQDVTAEAAGSSSSRSSEPSPSGEFSGEIDKAGMDEMGIAIEEKPKGVWQRVKGVFGR